MARSPSASEFSVVTDRAAVQNTNAATQDPFEIMRLGEDMEHQYLSDATGRLTNPDLWGATAELEIQELARGTNQEIQMKLGELTSKFQEVTRRHISNLRLDIRTMARVILEILQQSEADSPELQKERDLQLKDTMKRIKETFEEQEQLFSTRSMKHGQEILRLLAGSRWKYWFAAIGGVGAVAILASTFLVGKVGKNAAYITETTETKPSTQTTHQYNWFGWLKNSSTTTTRGTITTKKRFDEHWIPALFAVPIMCILGVGLLPLWSFWSIRQKKELETQAQAENIVRTDLKKHKTMWQGVRMSVDVVDYHFNLLGQMGPERKIHRDTTIKEIAQSLWSMSMAMDEMTLWMNDRGCFPPNFSVKNFIGAPRHDRIMAILNQAKAMTAQPAIRYG